MSRSPYPLLRSVDEIADLQPRRWVECASCMESAPVDERDETAREWSEEHAASKPGHRRYRLVAQVAWTTVPSNTPEPAL